MKAFLILWAMGLAACDKLDRTYLPPPGSITSGGNPDDLNLPLEFPIEKYHSTSKSENDSKNINNFTKTNYPNVAIDTERQGPSVSPTESLTTGPGDFSKKIAYSLSTIKPYGFTQTTSSSPIDNYKITIGSVNNQGYASTVSPFDKNLNYPHQIVNDLRPPGISLDPDSSRVIPQNVQSTHMEQIQHKSKIGGSVYGDSIYSNLSPLEYSTARYPFNQYGGNFDSTAGVAVSRIIPESYYDQNKPKNDDAKIQKNNSKDQYYSTPYIFENIDEENKSYAPENKYGTSTFMLNKYAEAVPSTSAPIKSSSAYPSVPKYFSENFASNYNAHVRPDRPQAAADRNAVIINYENILTPEGFAYSYDTSNGIHADESGTAKDGVKAQGSYSYIGDDGQVYNITYTADENGFLPRGDHLPTAPPVPDAILKVIEEAEKNRKLGVIDDGTYDDSKYGHARYQGPFGHTPPSQFSGIYEKLHINKGYMPNTKSISIENKDIPSNDENSSDQINISGQYNEISRRPHADNDNKEEEYKNDEAFSTNNANPSNDQRASKNDKVKNKDNRLITRPVGKSTDHSVKINELPEGHYVDYTENFSNTGITSSNDKLRNGTENLSSNPNIHTSKAQIPISNVGHDNTVNILVPSHTGYEYTRPQQTFNGNYKNNFQFGFPNTNEETVKLIEGEIRNPQTGINSFVSQKIQTTELQRPQEFFRDRMTILGHKNTIHEQNDKDRFSNGMFEKSDDEPIVVADGLFQSTSRPEYGTTVSNYQYPYRTTLSGNERRYNYPTSTLSAEYISTTTPLPPQFSSSLPPSTIGFAYTGTTSAIPQFSSTTRPVVDSKFDGSSTHRPGPKISGTINKVQEFIQETPQMSSSHYGIVPEFSIPDYRTQNIEISTGPRNHGGQTTTKRVIGEDFSGPKQLQRFDPVYGYYY